MAYLAFAELCLAIRVDDPLDAFAVHFGGGLWGLVSACIVTEKGLLFALIGSTTEGVDTPKVNEALWVIFGISLTPYLPFMPAIKLANDLRLGHHCLVRTNSNASLSASQGCWQNARAKGSRNPWTGHLQTWRGCLSTDCLRPWMGRNCREHIDTIHKIGTAQSWGTR